MKASEFHTSRKFAETPFGRIAYVERGSGPVALFIHGLPLNGFQWHPRVKDARAAWYIRRRYVFITFGPF